MYICVCNSVTDGDIRDAVDAGVRSLRQLIAETGCSTGCGKCTDLARQELADALVEKRQFLHVIATPASA
jgi:bacterioferritin-associated ferredoxin